MKKQIAVILSLVLLAGCNNETLEKPKETKTTEVSNVVKEENELLVDLLEYEVIAEFIDLTVYTADIQSDNPGTRIIFFEDAKGSPVYKSVFVKTENHLKIIKLDDEGIIYNEIIQ